MIMVGIAVIYWTLLVVYKANQPLDCTDRNGLKTVGYADAKISLSNKRPFLTNKAKMKFGKLYTKTKPKNLQKIV